MCFQIKNLFAKLLLLVGFVVQPSMAAQEYNNTSSPNTSDHQSLLHNLSSGKIDLQLGLFSAYQGSSQNIAINGLVGDHFSVTSHSDQNALLGIGYFIDAPANYNPHLKYGINAFYLADTMVTGHVFQEMKFENLSYRYNVTNFPLYLALKSIFKTKMEKYSLTIDLGIGPNIIKTGDFSEKSLDGGFTQPDRIYSGNTSITFSAMAGLGVKFNNLKVYHESTLECGYRFFYLGQGDFNKLNNQVRSTLKTGNGNANALICSVAV